MSIRFASLTLAALIGASASAAIAAQTTAARPGTPAANTAQQVQTRAAVIKNLDTSFKSIDKNGNGTLDAAELSAAEAKTQQQRIAAMRSRVEANFTKLDTNKDGSLSKAEFMAVAPTAPASTNNGAQMVTQLDKNKDGKIAADEFRAPQLAVFDRLDSNKDGSITPAERQAARVAQKR